MTPEGSACQKLIIHSLNHYHLPDSESAVRLLCMVAAHESGGFHYVRQNRGPALSFFQIEPPTFADLCTYASRRGLRISEELPCDAMRLVFDARFAAGMSRVFFLRFREPLPEPGDITALAGYAKQYWNTHLGRATVAQYRDAWLQHFTEESHHGRIHRRRHRRGLHLKLRGPRRIRHLPGTG